MVEQASQKEESQQPDSGRTTTPGRQADVHTCMGHQDNHRSGRQELRGADSVVMSDRQKYRLVETYRLDTWAFIMFFAICGAVSYL